MQILIDSATDSPAALRRAVELLAWLADSVGTDAEVASINGAGEKIILNDVNCPSRHKHTAPHIDAAAPDPIAAFGVPAGTSPVSSAPVLPAPIRDDVFAPAATAGSPAVDSAGLPWDPRIHSETRKQNTDGSWRLRRNLDADVRERVTAELRQLPLPLGQPSVPVPTPTPSVTLPPLPLPPPATVRVPDAPNPPVVPAMGFRELMTKINVARANGKLTQEQMEAACRAAGVDSVVALAAQPALVPTVDQHVSQYIGAAA